MAKRKNPRKTKQVKTAPSPQKPPQDVPVEPAKPLGKPRWYTRPLFITSAIGVTALAVLGVLNANRLKIQTPSQASSLSTRINAAALDSRHGMSDPYADFAMRTSRPKGLKMAIPSAKSCVACHQMKDLPDQLAERLLGHENALLQLFPPETVHSRLRDSLVAYPPLPIDFTAGREELSHLIGQTNSWGVQFRLQGIADPLLRAYVEPHEIAHLMTQVPGDYLPETWAYAAGTLTTPLSVLRASDSENEAPKYVAILQRARLFRNLAPSRLAPAQSANEAHAELQRFDEESTRRDLSAFAPLFREAFREYRRNTVFWDAAAYKYQNPYLVFDVFLARHLRDQQQPALLASLSDPEKLARLKKNLAATGEIRRLELEGLHRTLPPDEAHSRRVFLMDEMSSDIRNAISAQSPPHLSQQQLDGEYYAAQSALFLKPDGAFRYDALKPGELKGHVRKKLRLVQMSLRDLETTREILRSQVSGSEEDRRILAGRTDQMERLHLQTRSALEKMLRTGRFVRP